MKLEVVPILLAKPVTQSPLASLSNPPPPAIPESLATEPSVFKVNQPFLGFSQLIFFRTNLLVAKELLAQK